MVRSVEDLNEGTLKPEPQSADPDDVLRTFPRRPEDSRLDWSWSTERILRMIRASSHPFAGAISYLEGERRVTIWRAERHDYATRFLAVPGQVCLKSDEHPVIACADGMVRLTDVEV